MIWFLLAMFTGSVEVVPMQSKAHCEEIRAVLLQSYGKGSALVDAKCVSMVDGKGK